MDDPTSNPFEASDSLVPSSVIAGPPIERVVPSIATAVLPSGVKVSPPAVSALSLPLLVPAVARAIVDVSTIRDPALLIEYLVPPMETVDPGRSVEWPISKPPSLPRRAVNVWEPIVSSDLVRAGVGAGVEKSKLDVPTTTPDGPSEMRVPDIVTAFPPCVRAIPSKEKTAALCGEGVGFAATGVYVIPPITIGLESACAK